MAEKSGLPSPIFQWLIRLCIRLNFSLEITVPCVFGIKILGLKFRPNQKSYQIFGTSHSNNPCFGSLLSMFRFKILKSITSQPPLGEENLFSLENEPRTYFFSSSFVSHRCDFAYKIEWGKSVFSHILCITMNFVTSVPLSALLKCWIFHSFYLRLSAEKLQSNNLPNMKFELVNSTYEVHKFSHLTHHSDAAWTC